MVFDWGLVGRIQASIFLFDSLTCNLLLLFVCDQNNPVFNFFRNKNIWRTIDTETKSHHLMNGSLQLTFYKNWVRLRPMWLDKRLQVDKCFRKSKISSSFKTFSQKRQSKKRRTATWNCYVTKKVSMLNCSEVEAIWSTTWGNKWLKKRQIPTKLTEVAHFLNSFPTKYIYEMSNHNPNLIGDRTKFPPLTGAKLRHFGALRAKKNNIYSDNFCQLGQNGEISTFLSQINFGEITGLQPGKECVRIRSRCNVSVTIK